MKSKKFSGLFEDEIAEELRSAGPDCVIRSNPFSWRRSCAVLEDGIYDNDTDLFLEYINGRRSGYVSRGFVLSVLTHNEFTIEEA